MALSIAALAISFSWWVSFFLGVALMMAYQVFCCCLPPKPYFFALSLVSLVEAVILVYAGIDLLSNTTPDFCWPFFSLDLTCNDARSTYAVLSFCAAVLWLAAAVCAIAFVASGKHDEFEANHAETNNAEPEDPKAEPSPDDS